MFSNTLSIAAGLAVLPAVLAQTFTSCNPLTATCPADAGLAQASWSRDFTTGDLSQFTNIGGSAIGSGSNGAQFTITADGQAPTIESNFYIFFGRVDVVMKAAPGTGIVSSIVLESDDLDEIDWEFLGGDTTQAQTNFFGKGDTTTYDRGAYNAVASPQTQFHTYSIDWTAERIEWLIDGTVVRTVPYTSPLANAGANYPQTPAQIKLGSWVAGGANSPAGTVQWAGGKTDFSQAPFTMYVKSISVTNYSPAASYTYGDHSGSYKSIVQSGAVAAAGSSAVSTTSLVTTATAIQSSLTTQVLTSIGPIIVPVQSTTAISSSSKVITSTTSVVSTSTYISTTLLTSTSGVAASTGTTTQSRTSSSASATTSGPVMQTANSAASVHISTVGSLLSLAAAFFLF